jgi:parallel beta-helix repeat protein
MYYNTNLNKLRCYENGAWTDCIAAGGSGANTTLSNLGSTNINAALNATSANLTLQTTTSGNIILNAAGTTELQDDTNVGGNLTIATDKYLKLTGGTTANRPGTPSDGMMFYDQDTDQLLTYTGGKWKADGTEAILVAATDSSAADKAAADYIADGTDDQVQINAALTSADPAGSGRKTGKVYLFGGTYTTHQTNNTNATILVPNNVTLAGAGSGTVVRLGDIDATDNLIENSDKTTGTGVIIRDMKLDGQDTANTAGTQSGIYLNTIGNGTTQGAKIVNVEARDFRDIGIVLDDSDNSIVERSATIGSGYGISISWGSTNNTITGNKFQSNSSTGMYLNDGTHNNITSNNLLNNGSGGVNFESSSQFNTFTGNSLRGNGGNSIRVASSYNTITGNIVYANGDAIDFVGATYNTVSGNNVDGAGGSGVGFRFESSSNNNTITGNNFRNTGGSTTNNAIYIDASDSNVISNNGLTDASCSSNCYAINIFNSTSDNTYLSGNVFNSPAIINDSGTGTIYANQSKVAGGLDALYKQAASTTAFQIQNASGAAMLTTDTSTAVNRIQVGSATTDATAIFFMLDRWNSGTDPTGTGAEGAMYYNTNTNKFRCFENNAWADCVGANKSLSNLTTTAINQSLIAGSSNSIDIGSSGTTWRSGYFGTAVYAPALRPLSDSSTALLIQNAAGSTTIFTVNSSSNNVLIGNGTDGVTIGTTGIILTGTARPDVTLTISPEFQGAAFTGDGTNNNGSLSSDFCSGSSRQNINAGACGATETHNYYNWTTTQASAQDYDIYVRYQLPSDYSTGSLSNMKIWGWGTTSANEEVTVAMYVDGTAAACSTSSDVITSNTTWQQVTVASPLGSCTPAAGDMVTFKVHIAAGQNNNARAGAINISYKRAN